MRKKKVNPESPPAATTEEAPTYAALVARCALYGIKLTADQINGWDEETRAYLKKTLDKFDDGALGDAEPVQVPEWMLAWDAPTDEEKAVANSEGKGWRAENADGIALKCCPYPVASRLGVAWIEGANNVPATVPAPESTESVTAAPAPETVPEATQPEAAKPPAKVVEAKPAKEPKQLTCTKRDKALLVLVKQLGPVTSQCNEAEGEYHAAQQTANGRKKAWEALQKQMQGICTQLGNVANGGDYQAELFDEPTRPPEQIKPPHPEVHQEGSSKPAEPEKPVEQAAEPVAVKDEGGDLELTCLITRNLVKLCGDAWSEYGLTKSKVEVLSSAVGGNTIAALEKFQRENTSWNRDIKGFGEQWVDKLQDAHSAIRKKFPMPELGASPSVTEPEATATDKPAETPATETKGTVLDSTTEAPVPF